MPTDALQQYLAAPGQAAFTDLIRYERDAVLGAAWRVLGDRSLAEDVTQEVFMGIFDSAPERGSVRSGRGWLISRTLGLARTRLRSDSRRSAREAAHVLEREPELDPLEARELRDAVFALPTELGECVELRYFGGLSASEVGEQLGCAKRTVNERLKAACEKLRGALSGGAFGMIAPCMLGDVAPPTISTSAEFAETLDALVQTHFAGTAAATFKLGAGAIALMLSLTVATVVGFVWSGETDGSAQESELENLVAVMADEPKAGATIDPLSETESVAPLTQRVPVARDAAGGTTLEVRVVDAAGALLQHGTLELSPELAMYEAFAALSEAEQQRLSPYLAPLNLESHNPLILTDLPDTICGFQCTVRATVAALAAPIPLEFVLEPGKRKLVELVAPVPDSVRVHVVDAKTREPLVGATVISITERTRRDLPVDGEPGPDGPGLARTDSGGYALLGGLGSGTHSVNTVAAGYRMSERAWSVEGRSTLEIHLERIDRPASIAIFVRSPAGEPVAGLTLSLSHRSAPNLEGVTDDDGRFRFDGLDPGNYTAWLDIQGLLQRFGDTAKSGRNKGFGRGLMLAAGEELELVMGFLEGSASWTIVLEDASGKPVAGHAVSAYGPAYLQGKTDSDGRVHFEGIPDGEWSLSADPFWTPTQIELAVDEVRRDVLAIGKFDVVGVVTSASGELKRCHALLEGAVSKFAFCPAGALLFERPPVGEYLLHIGAEGHVTRRLPLTIRGDQPLDRLAIELQPGRQITLNVPLSMVAPEFELNSSDGTSWEIAFDANDDTWRSEVLPTDSYTLEIRAEGSEPLTRRVRLGSETDVIIDLDAD